MSLYGQSEVDNFVFGKLADNGYEIHSMEGALVDGYICIAPSEKHYNFIFQPKFLNEWSSALTMRRCRKLPKWAIDYINANG